GEELGDGERPKARERDNEPGEHPPAPRGNCPALGDFQLAGRELAPALDSMCPPPMPPEAAHLGASGVQRPQHLPVGGGRPRDRPPAPEDRADAGERDERSPNLITRESTVVGSKTTQRTHLCGEEKRKGAEGAHTTCGAELHRD